MAAIMAAQSYCGGHLLCVIEDSNHLVLCRDWRRCNIIDDPMQL